MKMVPVQYLQVGDKLGKPIWNDSGNVLVCAGTSLTSKMIQRLIELGVQTVFIQDPLLSDIHIQDTVTEETRQRSLQTIYLTYQQMMEAKRWSRGFSVGKLGERFREMMKDILYEIQSQPVVMLHLSSMYSKSHYLYDHSVNVGIYAAALGVAMGLKTDQLLELGVGAMLHDVGKIQVDVEILEKPSGLTDAEFDEMKKHTLYGYDFLRSQPDLPLLVAHCALQHHERLDGSGYPRGIKSDEIHLYGRIIGIVDSYDAMVTNRVYRKAFLPHEALEMLYASTNQYDLEIMNTFRNHLIIYPVGMSVKLSTGYHGVVVDTNSNHPHRPIVRILCNEIKEKVTPYEIDLSSQLSVMITDCNVQF